MMSGTKIYLTLLLLAILQSISGQDNDTLNFTDSNGLMQGKWVKYYENGFPRYEGIFRNGKPVGEFIRYHETGGISSILDYHEGSDSATAVFFHPNGFIAAKGLYIGQDRQGTWEFYSAYIKDYLLVKEEYDRNIKQGKSTKYYWNGNVAEEFIYDGDKKNGPWHQYYTDGVMCISSIYKDGKLNGAFNTFHTSGAKEITGTYNSDVRVGEWTFYNEDGSVRQKIVYNNGIPENNEELIKAETDYLDQLEKNSGKIEDPEKTGKIW